MNYFLVQCSVTCVSWWTLHSAGQISAQPATLDPSRRVVWSRQTIRVESENGSDNSEFWHKIRYQTAKNTLISVEIQKYAPKLPKWIMTLQKLRLRAWKPWCHFYRPRLCSQKQNYATENLNYVPKNQDYAPKTKITHPKTKITLSEKYVFASFLHVCVKQKFY